jgi:HAD superfamily hydrolase (TIGR01509 family)
MPIKAVVFDLDGTIAAFNLDYKGLRAEIRGYLIKKGVPASVLKVNETMFDMLKKTNLYMTHAGKSNETIQKTRQEVIAIADRYELEAATRTSLLPGVLETLKNLKKNNLKIGLCTISGSKSAEYIFQRFKLTEYFDAVVTREKVTQVKPHAEHCQAALLELGVQASETVVVGDGASDMQAAKEVKAIAVGLPTGVGTKNQLVKDGANYIITSITDLPILIETINKIQSAT